MDDLNHTSRAARLPLQGPHWHANPANTEAGTALIPLRLVLYPGGGAIELTRPDMVVGRHSQADVRLHLPDVSRRHCRFVFSEGQWQIFDLQSTNGVYLNDQPVQQATLRHHDLIRIGSYTFEVDLRIGSSTEALPNPDPTSGQRQAS
jgi:pSer/pThr/pTyr-binding forkhead associated (FHA) protein